MTTPEGFPRTVVRVVAVLSFGALLALGAARLGAQGLSSLTDAELRGVVDDACERNHPIEEYRGRHRQHDVIGPLWLTEPGKDRARGVILTPFLRLYHFGRLRRCGELTPEQMARARDLAHPEVWVVLWRVEDPPNPPFQTRTTATQKVQRPREARYRADGSWHKAVSTRTSDRWMESWFGRYWRQRESLLAVFPTLDRSGALHVEYGVEERGRSYLTESEVFPTNTVDEKWWSLAFGADETRNTN